MAKSKEKKPDAPVPAYVMPAPNQDVHDWGTLRNVRHGKVEKYRTDDGKTLVENVIAVHSIFEWPSTMDRHFLLVDEFETMCLTDKGVQAATAQCIKKGYNPASIKVLTEAVASVFEDQYLVKLFELFQEVMPTIGQYFAARAAYRKLHPEEENESGHTEVNAGPRNHPRKRSSQAPPERDVPKGLSIGTPSSTPDEPEGVSAGPEAVPDQA